MLRTEDRETKCSREVEKTRLCLLTADTPHSTLFHANCNQKRTEQKIRTRLLSKGYCQPFHVSIPSRETKNANVIPYRNSRSQQNCFHWNQKDRMHSVSQPVKLLVEIHCLKRDQRKATDLRCHSTWNFCHF